jgi:predicted dehydrogenase
MLRVGFVGAGFVAKFHATALCSVRGVELAGVTALAGADALSGEARRLGIGAGTVFPTVGELCKNVDVVAIFAPNYARLEVMQMIGEARRAGAELKGVICEKPLARNLSEAEALVTAAREAQLLTAYFENQIHMPAVRNARAQLASVEQAMGPVHLTRSAEEHGGPHEPWFWDPTRQGGGVLCDMGCHSIAVGWYMLTPSGKHPSFLSPRRVTAQTMLLKWALAEWRSKLMARGVDYSKHPAEDYATGSIAFQHPETHQTVLAQFTDSWMYDAPGLRLLMEALGPGYSYTVNSLESPAGLFISDEAASAVVDKEIALEKAQASRGALVLQPNEADLYGYVSEWRDAVAAFREGRNAFLDWEYGRAITRLVMAAYLSAEKGMAIDLGDPKVSRDLNSYVPAIQAGEGAKVLGR